MRVFIPNAHHGSLKTDMAVKSLIHGSSGLRCTASVKHAGFLCKKSIMSLFTSHYMLVRMG
jgi:hypothetical protein